METADRLLTELGARGQGSIADHVLYVGPVRWPARSRRYRTTRPATFDIGPARSRLAAGAEERSAGPLTAATVSKQEIVSNQRLPRSPAAEFPAAPCLSDALPALKKCSYTVVMKNAVVRARIDADLKANAARVLAACGLELSDAIRLYLQQVVAHRGIPFEIRSASEPSMAELQALKRKSQERDHRIARSVDVSKGQMLLLKPARLRGAKVRWPKTSLV